MFCKYKYQSSPLKYFKYCLGLSECCGLGCYFLKCVRQGCQNSFIRVASFFQAKKKERKERRKARKENRKRRGKKLCCKKGVAAKLASQQQNSETPELSNPEVCEQVPKATMNKAIHVRINLTS